MTANEQFNQYLNTLDNTQLRRLTIQIRKHCDGVSRYVIYNWRTGRTPIRESYKTKINQLAGTRVFPEKEIV